MGKSEGTRPPSAVLTPAKKRAIRKQAEIEVALDEKRLRRRLAIAGIALVVIWIVLIFGSHLQAWIAQVPVLNTMFSFFYVETTSITVVGLFIVIFLDTLFFVIFPGELYFFLALAHGMNPAAAVAAAALGGVLGHICNYWMGRYARRKGKVRPRGARLIRFAERANGRGGTPFLALAFATPSPEIIGFAYGLGNYPAGRFAVLAAVFRTLKWVILFFAFLYLRSYLSVFGI
jgi:membrane protein YqaA with SNARE-associated domain